MKLLNYLQEKKIIFRASECAFSYRSSIFKTQLRNKYLITHIVLALHKEARFSISYQDLQQTLEKMKVQQLSFKVISEAIIAIRQSKLPDISYLGNAGSFFQNPLISIEHYQSLKRRYPFLVAFPMQKEGYIKISAAWLIEAAGFKGLRQNNVGVYDVHALILVHYGGAVGRDILNLALQIQEKVAVQFNILLVPEVTIVYDDGSNRCTLC